MASKMQQQLWSVVPFLLAVAVGFQIDLSTVNGYQWKAALPNKSKFSLLFFLSLFDVTNDDDDPVFCTVAQASKWMRPFREAFTLT